MKNKLKHLVPVLLALATITVSLSACELKPKAQQKVSKQGFYFDTIIQITLYGTTDEKYIDDCFASFLCCRDIDVTAGAVNISLYFSGAVSILSSVVGRILEAKGPLVSLFCSLM